MKDKVAFVVGGTGGIGTAISKELSAREAIVFIGVRNKEDGESLAKNICESGGKAFFVPTDLTNESSIKEAIDTIVSKYGHLGFAVNNAAVSLEQAALADSDTELFVKTVDTNIHGVYWGMKYQVQQMLKNNGGSIVNISSVAGLKGFQGLGAYVASKHAVQGLTKSAALDYASQGIRINSVAPGPTQTEAAAEHQKDGFNQADYIPMKKMGRPTDVAKSVAWLLSDESGHTTGSTIMVEGGLLA